MKRILSIYWLTCLAVMSSITADQGIVGLVDHNDEVEEALNAEADITMVKRKKCLKVKNLVVCNDEIIGGNLTVVGNETIDGNLSVGGTVTTLTGAPITAAVLAYGEVGYVGVAGTPQTVDTGDAVAFNYTGPVSGGVTPTTSSTAPTGLTIATAGVYLFEYQVDTTADVASSIQLQVNGVALTNSTFTAAVGVAQNTGFIIASVPADAAVTLYNNGADFTLTGTGIGAKLDAIRLA